MVVVALRMCLQYGRSFSLWRSSCPITTDVTTLICSGLSSVYPKKRAAAVAASLMVTGKRFAHATGPLVNNVKLRTI